MQAKIVVKYNFVLSVTINAPAFISFRRPSEFSDAVDLIEVASVVSDIFSFDIEIFILIEFNPVLRFAISKGPTIVSTDPDIGHEGSHTVM